MYRSLTMINDTNRNIRVISEVKEFNKLVIRPRSKFTFAAELDEDLKIFSKKVRLNNRDYLWVGIVDKDAFI